MRITLPIVAAVLLFCGSVAAAQPVLPEDLGRRLFEARCASCHGIEGSGGELGPSLDGVGEAAVDFQLRTGRMPLVNPDSPTVRKPPAFTSEEIDALVAYVGRTGGPPIPAIDAASGELPEGAELFASNCAACHGATGNGGAVGEAAFAPSLFIAEPVEIAEAIVTGPGEMPRFAFDEDQQSSIVAYIGYLKQTPDPGGLDIGGVGPVPEGFVAWAVGMLLLVVVVVLIGRRGGHEE